jgi:hypothetical protein
MSESQVGQSVRTFKDGVNKTDPSRHLEKARTQLGKLYWLFLVMQAKISLHA